MPLSAYLAAEFAKYAFTGTAAAAEPSAWYVSLHTADPGTTGASEVTGSAYARQGSVTLTRTAGTSKNSSAAVTFPTVTTTPYTVTHFGLWDAASSGNFLIGGALDLAKVLSVGEAASFAIDELIFTIA